MTATEWTAVEAVGTLALFVVAFVQIAIERSVRRRHALRDQAEHVSGWITGEDTGAAQPIALLNASHEPVYRAVVYMVFIQGGAPRTGQAAERAARPEGWRRRILLSVLPPGRYEVEVEGGWGAMSARPGVEMAFTDRAGVHWVRSAEGTLSMIKQPALEHYGLVAPADWRAPPSPLSRS